MQAARPRDRLAVARRRRRRGGRLPAQERPGAGRHQQGIDGVAHRPDQSLTAQGEHALQHEGIGEQSREASRVSRRVEGIGIVGARQARAGEPALQERAGGSQHEEGEPHRAQQRQEEPSRGPGAAHRRRDGGKRRRKEEAGHQQERQVQGGLPARGQGRRHHVRVEIAQQQRGLEEHHAGVPDRGRPAQQRQQHAGGERLHEEEQSGTQEDGRHVGTLHFSSVWTRGGGRRPVFEKESVHRWRREGAGEVGRGRA